MSSEKISRRRFLQTSSTAAALWIPAGVNGYTQQEMLSFASEEGMQKDISKWDLDTPSLCLDLDALEANIATCKQQSAATASQAGRMPRLTSARPLRRCSCKTDQSVSARQKSVRQKSCSSMASAPS